MNSKHTINHISFIMDGNGRWAKKRFLPRTAGHSAGVLKAKEIVLHIKKLKIPYLSLYTFSKENWKRPPSEVSFLMKLIIKNFKEDREFYQKNRIKLVHIGDRQGLSEELLDAIDHVVEDTKNYDSLTVLIALNYSGKYDIIQAVNKIKAEQGSPVDEKIFENYLLTSAYPDPDLIIRTSGEFRMSNYFLWQAAYSELSIVDKFWPDLKTGEVDLAIQNYHSRQRRFGGV